jgi:ABC-type Na+ efflux pump permease subunit
MLTSDFVSLAYTIALSVLAVGITFTHYRILAQAIGVVIIWVLFGALLAAATPTAPKSAKRAIGCSRHWAAWFRTDAPSR